jgi:DNA-binding response OmpR family regulator
MITDERPAFHPRYSYCILYAGNDLLLTQFLKYMLEDCQVVRCPNGSQARLFIKSIKYSLLLFNEELPDTTGIKLTRFVHSLAQREHMPIIIFEPSNNFELLARAIARLLVCSKSRRSD